MSSNLTIIYDLHVLKFLFEVLERLCIRIGHDRDSPLRDMEVFRSFAGERDDESIHRSVLSRDLSRPRGATEFPLPRETPKVMIIATHQFERASGRGLAVEGINHAVLPIVPIEVYIPVSRVNTSCSWSA